MTGVWIILAHLAGDYLLQTHHQAVTKTKRWLPAITHGVTYTLPYALVTQSASALAVIGGSHIVIDRFRLARYVVWLKNLAAPAEYRAPLSSPTGYPADTPPWLAFWLLIIADNTIHLGINAWAVLWL